MRTVGPTQLLAGAGVRCPGNPPEALGQGPGFHAVLSDMCQATSLPAVDAVRSHELAACAAGLAVGPDAGFAPETGPLAAAAAGTQNRPPLPGTSAEASSSSGGAADNAGAASDHGVALAAIAVCGSMGIWPGWLNGRSMHACKASNSCYSPSTWHMKSYGAVNKWWLPEAESRGHVSLPRQLGKELTHATTGHECRLSMQYFIQPQAGECCARVAAW